jgi:hypothetical protein
MLRAATQQRRRVVHLRQQEIRHQQEIRRQQETQRQQGTTGWTFGPAQQEATKKY